MSANELKTPSAGADASSVANGHTMDKKLGMIAIIIATSGMGLVGTFSRGATRDGMLGAILAGTPLADLTMLTGDSVGAFLESGRMITALLFYTIVLIVTKKLSVFKATKFTPALALSGLFLGLSLACYVTSTLMTSLANAVFLLYTGPVVCTILARIFRKEHITPFQYICFAFVFVGMLFTSEIISITETGLAFGLDFGSATPDFPQKGGGDLLALMSGPLYGMSLFFSGYRADCDVIVRGVWHFLFATLAAVTITFILNSIWPLGIENMRAENWGWAIGLFISCGPVALGCLLLAGRNLPAVEYSTMAYWECVVALLASFFIFHEALSLSTIIGGVMIFAGGLVVPVVSILRGTASNEGGTVHIG